MHKHFQTLKTVLIFQEIAELKRLLDRDTHADIKEHWKGELSRAIREIQTEYDAQLDNLRGDMESKYEAQVGSKLITK